MNIYKTMYTDIYRSPCTCKGGFLLETTITRFFSTLPDPRIERCKLHHLIDIVTITLCAVISNADGWEDIEAYGRTKEKLFRTSLALPHGIPSHDTFARLFARLNPEAFQACFINWVAHIRTTFSADVIAVDGKTIRATRDSMQPDDLVHMVSAWSSANQLVLGQLRTSAKSNEITAIPQLLALLDIRDSTVTIDALGCQTAIAATIRSHDSHYVLACKKNQEHLYDDIVATFAAAAQSPDAFPVSSYVTHEQHHGRSETREYWSTEYLHGLRTADRWDGLQSIIMVRSTRKTPEKTTDDTRYFITSHRADAIELASLVRSHWSIENQLHWVLDVVFHEDTNRARNDYSGQNLAIIRHIAFNLLKQESSLKKSMRQKRLRAGWDDTYMLKVLQLDNKECEHM